LKHNPSGKDRGKISFEKVGMKLSQWLGMTSLGWVSTSNLDSVWRYKMDGD
jgi:hypothetical protein